MAFLGAVVAAARVLAPRSAVGTTRAAVSAVAEIWDLTTVADDEVVFHLHSPDTLGVAGDWSGPGYEVITGLKPGSPVLRHGIETRTLERPGGELLCRFATVNDTHFGETECGTLADVSDALAFLAATGAAVEETTRDKLRAFLEQLGPLVVNSSPEGARPYPEMMSHAAVTEIVGYDPAAMVVKGDLTASGLVGEYEAFLQCYHDTFGDRLLHVRGNHDAFTGRRFASESFQERTLPGVVLAVLDTVIEGRDSGRSAPSSWSGSTSLPLALDRPVLVFGHHHPWKPGGSDRSGEYFGINPNDSEHLVELIARRPAIVGYFAGHTHRNRVRRFAETGASPTPRSPR